MKIYIIEVISGYGFDTTLYHICKTEDLARIRFDQVKKDLLSRLEDAGTDTSDVEGITFDNCHKDGGWAAKYDPESFPYWYQHELEE